MKNKEKKAQGLVNITLVATDAAIKHVLEMEEASELSSSIMDDIVYEFIIFNLHQFNRLLFDKFGENGRNELMDDVVAKLQKHLISSSSEVLSKDDANLTVDILGNYLQSDNFHSKAKNFISLYNEREAEYSHYNEEPEKGKGLAGTLLWEFGKKIADIMGKEYDLSIIMKTQQLGISYTFFADRIKEALED